MTNERLAKGGVVQPPGETALRQPIEPVAGQVDSYPVLVVDDEHGVRDLMMRWLRMSGYASLGAATAEEAVEHMRREPIAVALVDIHMPGHDGHWLVEQFRRQSADVAIVMVTGLLDVSAACTSLQHGLIDYLVKPFSRERLREAVQRGFDWHRASLGDRRWSEQMDADTQRLRKQLSDAFGRIVIDSDETLDAVIRILTLHERDLYDHLQRVQQLSVRLATALRRPEAEVETLRRAALVHDLARLALPPALFRKPQPLTDDERRLVREGPHFAYELLRSCGWLTNAAEVVRHRYERFDGQGFPGGLAGSAIPYASRILAVTDSFDTMLATRPYRPGVPPAEAVLELRRCAGHEYDPEIVAAVGMIG